MALRKKEPLRAAILGTGLLANHLLKFSGQDDVHIVAIGTTSADKVGAKASAILGTAGPDLTLEGFSEVLERDDIDVFLHAGPRESVWTVFSGCAALGRDVITSAGGFSISRDPDTAKREKQIVATAEQSGARLLSTGTFPGFTPDVLPITISRILPGPVNISVELVSDISLWSEGVLRSEVGIGSAPRSSRLDLLEYVIASAELITQSISQEVSDWKYSTKLLTQRTATQVGPIEVQPGDASGFELQAVASLVHSTVSVTWRSEIGGSGSGGSIIIHSPEHDLQVRTDIQGIPAYPSTAMRLIHSIRPLRTLRPGLRRAYELPAAIPRGE